jgi:hypothetical protein
LRFSSSLISFLARAADWRPGNPVGYGVVMLQVPNDWYGPHLAPTGLSMDVRGEPELALSGRGLPLRRK